MVRFFFFFSFVGCWFWEISVSTSLTGLVSENIILVFGSGGIKGHGTSKLSQNPHLQAEVDQLMKIEDSISERISNGELTIRDSGFEGNLLDFEIWGRNEKKYKKNKQWARIFSELFRYNT